MLDEPLWWLTGGNFTLQIVDMLEAFSSSADKSVGLEDFERMMVAAKMV